MKIFTLCHGLAYELPYRMCPGVRALDGTRCDCKLSSDSCHIVFPERGGRPYLVKSVPFLNNLQTAVMHLPDVCQTERSKV